MFDRFGRRTPFFGQRPTRILLLAALIFCLPKRGYADVIFSLDTFIFGDAIFIAPIAELTFTNAGTDTVNLEIRSTFVDPLCPEAGTCNFEGVSNILFNVAPEFSGFDAVNGSFGTHSGTFFSQFHDLSQDNAFVSSFPGGTGWDFHVRFSDFDGSDSVMFTLIAPGLTEDSFNVAQGDGYFAMGIAESCATPGAGCLNANYADANGGSPTAVPEPASVLLMGCGISIALLARNCRRAKIARPREDTRGVE